MSGYCKTQPPPCPEKCVSYVRDKKRHCRAKPGQGLSPKKKSTNVKSKPAVKKPAAPAPAPIAPMRPMTPMEREVVYNSKFLKQMPPRPAKEKQEFHKANYNTVFGENVYGEAMRGLFEEAPINNRRMSNRTKSSNSGTVVEMKVRDLLAKNNLTMEQINDLVRNSTKLSNYIRLRSKLTREELSKLSTLVDAARAEFKNAKNMAEANEIIGKYNICKYVYLESGRIYKTEAAKKFGEVAGEEIKMMAKLLKIKQSVKGVPKPRNVLCFEIAKVIITREEDMVVDIISSL